MFSRREELELKMIKNLLMVFTLLGTLQFIVPVISQLTDATIRFDTSDYKILTERRGGNFSYYAAKCRGALGFIQYQLLHFWVNCAF